MDNPKSYHPSLCFESYPDVRKSYIFSFLLIIKSVIILDFSRVESCCGLLRLMLHFTPMNKAIWILSPISKEAGILSRELKISPQIAQILINRDIVSTDAARKFLFSTLDDLHDPFLMKGMNKAVARIQKAITNKENILIFGDYDVDGILSVVMLTKSLHSLGAHVNYYIPDRIEKGYGLKKEYVDILLKEKASLAISVDCGIRAHSFVERALQEGIDVIVTDHHQPDSTLPPALSILNPVIPSCEYPDKRLAGVGVVFKLIQALFYKDRRADQLPHYLKLVSIGTVADVAELCGENRLFVKYGLKGLETVTNKGLKTLLSICGLDGKKISAGDVGFRIGPRINAAGRLGMTDIAVDLFFSETLEHAQGLVHRLEKLNSQRQRMEEKILNDVLTYIQERNLNQKYRIIILGCEGWHRGIIGIVASRIKDYYHRPVILFSYKDGKALGSGRSISDFSLIDCLKNNRHYLLNYGGHTQAVGCEVALDRLSEFKKGANAYAELNLPVEKLKPRIHIDTKIGFEGINFSFIQSLELLAPFGVGNPKPLFLSEKVTLFDHPRKLKKKHCKFLLKQNGRIFEGLGWGKGAWADQVHKGDCLDLVFSFQVSDFLGEERISLIIQDIRKSDKADER